MDEIVNDKEFVNSDTEIESYGSIEEVKFPQDYEEGVTIN